MRGVVQSDLIKTISYSQDEILLSITKLYLSGKPFHVDATFSKGVFYKSGVVSEPMLKFDINPEIDGVEQADCRNLPLKNESVRSIMIDLPFLATTGASLKKCDGNNLMAQRFGVYKNEAELYFLYMDAISEAYRVLEPNGVFVMKCQDKVSSGKQYMMHCDIYNWALTAGFKVNDLFVLLAKSRLVAAWQRNQKHARKFHSYFWVFTK